MRDALAFEAGELVRLCRLDEAFLSGVDHDSVERLKGLVGREWRIETVDNPPGLVEIVFRHRGRSPTPLDWITVSRDWLERV